VPRSAIEAQSGAIRRVHQHPPPIEVAVPTDSTVFPTTMQAGSRLARHESRRVHEGSSDAMASGLTDIPLVLGASPAGDHKTPCGAFPVPPRINVA
jgi:hypothetical protein